MMLHLHCYQYNSNTEIEFLDMPEKKSLFNYLWVEKKLALSLSVPAVLKLHLLQLGLIYSWIIDLVAQPRAPSQ